MIDLHCHLLPGIDDGPGSMEESLELCRIAVADGISHAVATPHLHPGRWDNSPRSIAENVARLRGVLDDYEIPLMLGFAAEVRLGEQVQRQVQEEQIPYIGEVDGYKIMLLEFPHSHIIPGSGNLTSWLLNRGVRPLLAHPERNRQIMKDPSLVYPFIEAGCWVQLTASSLTGGFGERAQAVAHQLMADDAVAVLASDAHNARARPPRLRQAFDEVTRHYGAARASRLMLHTPAAIAAQQFPEPPDFTTIAGAA